MHWFSSRSHAPNGKPAQRKPEHANHDSTHKIAACSKLAGSPVFPQAARQALQPFTSLRLTATRFRFRLQLDLRAAGERRVAADASANGQRVRKIGNAVRASGADTSGGLGDPSAPPHRSLVPQPRPFFTPSLLRTHRPILRSVVRLQGF